MKITELICRNCGAPISREDAREEVISCRYCRYETTLPKKTIAPDVLVALRLAENELANSEFDRAYESYARVAELDKNEPEAYFGMALAEHRVQYLKDEVNDRQQPICHRVSGKRFADNAHYKRALTLATKKQQEVYAKRAQEIDYIRAKFAEFNGHGMAYDIFICVKVTDDKQEHTEDSYIAEKLYYALKKENYRPFYSEVEVGDRTGVDYEALILYALYTSKCMLLVCLDEGYLRTKWVKNEYTRFLSLAAERGQGSERLALVTTGKPIERLPDGKTALQSIEYANAFGFEHLLAFVRQFCGKGKSAVRRLQKRVAIIAAALLCAAGVGLGIFFATRPDSLPASGTENPDATDGQIPGGQLPASDYTWSLAADGASYVVTGLSDKTLQALEIPATYNGLPVTAVAENAFSGCGSITSVTLPAGVTRVGAGAFSDCDGLATLTLPATVTDWGAGVLAGCDSLTSLSLSMEHIATLGALFGGADAVPAGLTQVTVSGNTLPENAFNGCENIVNVLLNGTMTAIGNKAFFDCASLMSVTLPSSLKTVGDEAFYNCSALVAVTLPDGVERIGTKAFGYCSALQMMTAPDTLTAIGDGAFYHCHLLGSFTVPAGVTSLGRNIFEGCQNLSTVTFAEKDGWKAGDTPLDAVALADAATAKAYLTATYATVAWERTGHE